MKVAEGVVKKEEEGGKETEEAEEEGGRDSRRDAFMGSRVADREEIKQVQAPESSSGAV